MKQEIGFCVGVLLCGILFPYIVTLIFSGDGAVATTQLSDSGYTVTFDEENQLDAEEYLVGVLATQMPAAWELEALKAQAVLLRTKLYKTMGDSRSISVGDTGMDYWTPAQMSQVWGNEQFAENYRKLQQAFLQTAGEILCFQGEPIEALYHYASGGITRADSSGNYPYLQSVSSEADLEADGYFQIRIFSQAEFAALINQIDENREVSSENIRDSIQVVSQDESGYLRQVQIGGCQYTGVEIANALSMSSSCISFQNYEEGLRVIGKGIGHGYGMSQWGAKKMAENASSYQDILLYYFPETEILK